MLFCVALVVAPAFAKADITAEPAEPYQTRGANPIDIRVLATDTNPGDLSYTVDDVSPAGASVGAFAADAGGATATFTPGDGYGGMVTVTVIVTNESTLEEEQVLVPVNVVPIARLLTGPGVDSPALMNDNTPTFTFNDKTGPGEVADPNTTFHCRVDNIPQGLCSSGTFTTAELPDGPHSFSVRATSSNSTADQFIPVEFEVDTVNPDEPTLEGSSGLSNITDHSWTFSVPEGTAECRLVGPGDPDPVWDDCAGPTADYVGLADGNYTFEVRTRDDAGNRSGIVSLDLEVDTVVDVTIDSAPANGNLDARPTIDFSSTEDPDVTYQCRFYEASTALEELPEFADCTSPFQVPFLDKNVEYTFDVTVLDEAGNTNAATTTWEQANTAPDIVAPEETLAAGATVNLDLGGSDADSDPITYAITGEVTGGTLGEIDQDNGTVDFTAAEDAAGTYEIEYEVSDAREAGVSSATVIIHVEPQTAFVEVPPAETNVVTPTWTFESPSGVTTFECRLDGVDPDPWENCDGGSFTAPTDLPEGPHTLEVRAIAEGLYADQTPESNTTIVDITAPDVAIVPESTPETLSNDPEPPFEFSSTDPTATFECKVEPAVLDPEAPAIEFEACVSGDPIAPLTDGDHTFTVRAVDPATNRGVEDSYSWEADLTAPVIDVTEGTMEGKWINLRKPSWNFTEADLNLVPESTTCTVDDQPLTNDCVGPWAPLFNLNDGMHTLKITSTDAAGNVGTKEINFRVTTITPTAVVDEGPATPSGPSASFKFAATTDLGEDGHFECRTNLNGGAYTAWADCDDELTLTGLSSGNRTLQVRAVDSAGNYSTGGAVGSWSWTTIGDAPDTVISSNVTNGGQAAFAFNSPGNALATFECSIDGGPFSACTSPKTFNGLGAGEHTFSVRAINQVGTADGSPASHTWTIAAAVAPNTMIDRRPPASTTATEASFGFSSTDASATYECRLDGGAWAACTSPAELTGLSVGEHTFDVRASANGKTDTTPASVTWNVTDPVIDPEEPPVCKPFKAKASKSKAGTIARGVRISVRLSHRNAVPGQKVRAVLLVNGKVAKGKLRKRAARALKNVELVAGGAVERRLFLGKPKATFMVAEDSPKRAYTVLIKRKKGKALRSSVAFTLNSCDQ